MKRTTPPPRKNILELLPDLEARRKTTVRLHPRKGKVTGSDKSKLGGTILWPKDEPWPTCEEAGHGDPFGSGPYPDGTRVPLIPVLQLRAEDFPEVEFYPGTDLLQLLWCPVDHSEPTFVAKPFVYWRNAREVKHPQKSLQRSELWSESWQPKECRLLPERVVEYPPIDHLNSTMRKKLAHWNIADVLDDKMSSPDTFYEWELSTCPANKVGGYASFIQSDETPRCKCGRRMEHLLTLTDSEFDAGTHRRWCPVEDKKTYAEVQRNNDGTLEQTISNAPEFDGFVGGAQYIFICRPCDHWPIASVFQR